MAATILRRILLAPVLLLGSTLLIFAMLQLLGPVERSALYVRDIPRNENAVRGIIQQYGFDQPFYLQYWHWLVGQVDSTSGLRHGGIFYGDLGYSRSASEPVQELIAERFPNTLDLTLWSILPILTVGAWLGIKAAVHQDQWVDQAIRLFSVFGASLPTFVFGLLLLTLFYTGLHWFAPGRMSDWAGTIVNAPTFRHYTHLLSIDALLNGNFKIFLDILGHMILPVLTLAYLSWASFTRVMRSAMIEALHLDCLTTARAKGLPEKTVMDRHARPNAMIPMVTMAGLEIVGLLGGVVVTETIFNFPGIGSAAASAAVQLDAVTLLGLAVFNGAILIGVNLLVDLLYTVIDPRIRLA
jgi:ABC-type dipeptide/oligopeptide/nickel transport systems, permease components